MSDVTTIGAWVQEEFPPTPIPRRERFFFQRDNEASVWLEWYPGKNARMDFSIVLHQHPHSKTREIRHIVEQIEEHLPTLRALAGLDGDELHAEVEHVLNEGETHAD
jgi:hypothetical protein